MTSLFVVDKASEKKRKEKSNSPYDLASWKGRDLKGYKEKNRQKAEEKGILKEFMAAQTLTQAKKILSGKR